MEYACGITFSNSRYNLKLSKLLTITYLYPKNSLCLCVCVCVLIKNVSCIHDMTGALSQLRHVQCDLAVTQLRIFNVAKAGAGMPPFFSCLPFNEAVGGSIRSSLTQQDQEKKKKNPHSVISEQWQLDFIETSIAFHHKSEPSRNRKRKNKKHVRNL